MSAQNKYSPGEGKKGSYVLPDVVMISYSVIQVHAETPVGASGTRSPYEASADPCQLS